MNWIKRLFPFFRGSPNGRLRASSFQLLQALEEERKRIARDIHDGPLQEFVALVMELDLQVHNSQRSRSPQMQEMGEQLAAMHQTGLIILKALRECLFAVRSPEIEQLGLHTTLRQCIHHLQEQTGLDIQLEVRGEYCEIHSVQALALYRIVHEALINIHKHAQARQAVVRLEFGPGEVSLSVSDDGQGFDVESGWKKENHMGLHSMRERAEMAGGRLSVESQPGQGTTVQTTVPILSSQARIPGNRQLATVLERRQEPTRKPRTADVT